MFSRIPAKMGFQVQKSYKNQLLFRRIFLVQTYHNRIRKIHTCYEDLEKKIVLGKTIPRKMLSFNKRHTFSNLF